MTEKNKKDLPELPTYTEKDFDGIVSDETKIDGSNFRPLLNTKIEGSVVIIQYLENLNRMKIDKTYGSETPMYLVKFYDPTKKEFSTPLETAIKKQIVSKLVQAEAEKGMCFKIKFLGTVQPEGKGNKYNDYEVCVVKL